MANAPWRTWLPIMGVVWAAAMGILYWFAGFKPIVDSLGNLGKETTLNYLNRTGISFTLIFIGVGIVIYVIQAIRRRAQGVDVALMYQEIPPE